MMICTALVTLVVAIALSFMWAFEKREKAVGWWCLSMWTATIATVLLAFRIGTPWWLGIGLGNGIALLAYGLVAAGFAAFRGTKINIPVIFAGAVVWFVLLFGSSTIREDVNNRVILISFIIPTYCALIVRDTWQIWKRERLPTLLAAAIFYGSHALFYLVRIPLTIASPVQEISANYGSLWYAVITLETFIHCMFTIFLFIALIRERAERRYRLAAEIDSLTGASSRRYFVAATREALARQPKSAFLAVLDLDFFKSINDTYGHMAGDKVLQSFAHHVALQLQPGMEFGRLGGEEFGLFLPDCLQAEACDFLERLRAGVEKLDIRFNGNVLKVTTSIGAASTEEAGFDFDHLMAGADNALYLAKAGGRNSVSIFSLAMRLEKIMEGGEERRLGLAKKRVSRVSVRSRPGRG
jgi:diguanylate cyclase (GGDEF)-like protein